MSPVEFELPSNRACRSCDPNNLVKYLVAPKEDPVLRPYVPDEKVDWNCEWPEYEPVYYIHPTVKCRPNWADPENTM